MNKGITIIGLGPADSQHWTLAAHEQLTQADEVYLRTAHHPSVADIPATRHSFDEWYQQSDDFDKINIKIANQIIHLGQREQGVIYAVPGHPQVGEATVRHIRSLADQQHIPLTIIPGISFIESVLIALNINPLDNLQISDAIKIAHIYHPPLNPDQPALIARLYGPEITRQVKQTLLNSYAPDFQVTLVHSAGTPAETIWQCPLQALDRQPHLDEWLSLYLPPDEANVSLVTFQNTMAHLLSPEGCPWDRKQTHQSLRHYLLEETYEVLEALDANDPAALAEELGDVLLQIALHTQMATRDGEFNMGQVIGHLNRKMLRRHPHVFGEVVVNGADEVITNWEAIKQAEKQTSDQSPPSALDSIPAGLPALTQALMISKKAVRAGFEWDDIEGVLAQIVEEVQEVAEATEPTHLEAEIGDLLFSLVNLARWRQIDPESALRTTNARFTRRFQRMEALARMNGQSLADMSLAEMTALWDEVKQILQTENL